MNNKKYQYEVKAPNGTKLVAESVPDGAENVCAGCYFEGEPCVDLRISNPSFDCDSTAHGNKNGIIWIEKEPTPQFETICTGDAPVGEKHFYVAKNRDEKEQPVPKSDTIKEIRAKSLTLQSEIYNLIKAFESDTDMVVHGVNLLHDRLIAARTTFGVELDVHLN